MTIVGAGAASGGAQLLPEVLAFSSSLALDKQLLREDLVGSLAHLIMLARSGIVPREAAEKIRAELVKIREQDLPVERQRGGEGEHFREELRPSRSRASADDRTHLMPPCCRENSWSCSPSSLMNPSAARWSKRSSTP